MGILTATPSIVTILNVAAGPVSIAVTTTNSIGPITASLADGSFVTLSGTVPGASGTFTITPTNPAGGDDVLTLSDGVTTLIVPIALGASVLTTNPTGTTLGSALSYIRLIADAPTQPTDADLATLLNQALTEVGDAIDQTLSTTSLPVAFGSPTVTLPGDIMDIVTLGYSSALPNVPGAIPYALYEIGPAEFMDFNAGVSSNYGLQPSGPVLYYTRLSDSYGRIRLMFSPLPPTGYLNVTYHPRVSLYDPTNMSSAISLDQNYFELVNLKTCAKVCMKQRDITRAQFFDGQYEKLLARKMISVGRRNNARSSVVRDVTSGNYSSMPPWYPG
jgi:hypothetical protein